MRDLGYSCYYEEGGEKVGECGSKRDGYYMLMLMLMDYCFIFQLMHVKGWDDGWGIF